MQHLKCKVVVARFSIPSREPLFLRGMRNPVVLLTRTLDPDTDSWGGPVALKIENQIPRERYDPYEDS